MISQNVVFFSMLILSNIRKNTTFQSDFPRVVYIFGHINKKLFFQNILQITSFCSKYWYLKIYGQKQFFQNVLKTNVLYPDMLIFTVIGTKIYFFKVIWKYCNLLRNFDICGFMDKKRFFFKMISKQLALPRNVDICGDMDKKLLFQYDLKKRRFREYVDIFE